MTVYTYGNTTIHDGINYFLQSKSHNMAPINTTVFKSSRQEGTKKTGDTNDDVVVTVSTIVVGSSRIQLLALLDTLYAGLALRQQHLTLQDTLDRHFNCDCVEATCTLDVPHLLQAVVAMKFRCYVPFAIGNFNTVNIPSALLSVVSGTTYTTGQQIITGGGNVYGHAIMTFTNNTPTNSGTLKGGNSVLGALSSGTAYTSIQLNAGLANAVLVGDTFILNDGAGHTQSFTASAAASAGATSITCTSFNANFSYPATTTTITKDTSITGISMIQSTDAQTISFSGISGFTNGHQFVIDTHPTSANGWTGLLDGVGSPWPYSGIWPVMEPGPTTWEFQCTANSPPTVAVSVGWNSRWLA